MTKTFNRQLGLNVTLKFPNHRLNILILSNFTFTMQHWSVFTKFSFVKIALAVIFTGIYGLVYGQVGAPPDSLKTDSLHHKGKKVTQAPINLNKQYDFGDLTRNIIHPHRKADTAHKSSGIIIVPNVAANPTIGAQAGIKAVVGTRLGGDPNTLLSVGATSASITTKGIIYFYINHNIFTPGNKWNLQGNLVVSKSVTPDDGFGIGDGKAEGTAADQVLAAPTHKTYAIHSLYFNFREKVYKEVSKGLFLGAGASIESRGRIQQSDTV